MHTSDTLRINMYLLCHERITEQIEYLVFVRTHDDMIGMETAIYDLLLRDIHVRTIADWDMDTYSNMDTYE